MVVSYIYSKNEDFQLDVECVMWAEYNCTTTLRCLRIWGTYGTHGTQENKRVDIGRQAQSFLGMLRCDFGERK